MKKKQMNFETDVNAASDGSSMYTTRRTLKHVLKIQPPICFAFFKITKSYNMNGSISNKNFCPKTVLLLLLVLKIFFIINVSIVKSYKLLS
jgi:hypothetical protein